ncbi:MAG: IS200/IS605 family transposase [Cyanobacteria bacterium QH_2_48_84]|nr:MAG: IS200/IS605 family transposase [Cyanobacteria bacterium QH_2_48_84]
MLERLRGMFWQVCRKMDCYLVEFSGEADHVHLLIDFHPKNSISAVVGSLKASTAQWLRKSFQGNTRNTTGENLFGLALTTLLLAAAFPIEKLKEYINGQHQPTH